MEMRHHKILAYFAVVDAILVQNFLLFIGSQIIDTHKSLFPLRFLVLYKLQQKLLDRLTIARK